MLNPSCENAKTNEKRRNIKGFKSHTIHPEKEGGNQKIKIKK